MALLTGCSDGEALSPLPPPIEALYGVAASSNLVPYPSDRYTVADPANRGGFHLAAVAYADTARLLADLMPGTVALPHGWGHQHATGLGVASKTRGVNVNLLAADGPDRLERVSGMAHLTGFLVDVKPAQGPHDPTSWSGIGA